MVSAKVSKLLDDKMNQRVVDQAEVNIAIATVYCSAEEDQRFYSITFSFERFPAIFFSLS